ncbi:hypothetical protein CHLRE_17g698516v5 [Chlamydomonas reinhardtii]|uniref:Uncharacterized protein n=1 Tax=Chlamydomonas reinhardtii TaxID=3055 RepID=A0A2K3CNR7_CHLRE|nr:uncharacterized protein CHLRE_17g698516v5 [Chlamydomonas reinhardtii]PNW69926.1 hypothetical protein CHLRE_17g698516v5 [Chlamydomonas reinhardtii]
MLVPRRGQAVGGNEELADTVLIWPGGGGAAGPECLRAHPQTAFSCGWAVGVSSSKQ